MASITPALNSITGPEAGVFTWSYSIAVDANESLNPPANAGQTCGAAAATCPQGVFFTLYDVPDVTMLHNGNGMERPNSDDGP